MVPTLDLHTGRQFWLVRDGLPCAYPRLRESRSAEVVVVGAGITGALVAYALTRAGARVIVVDRGEVVAGSSAASTGLLLYDTDTSFETLALAVGADQAARVYRLGLNAVDRIEALTREIGVPCGFCRRPSLYVASRRRDLAELTREFEQRQAYGLDVGWLDRRAIAERYDLDAPGAIYSHGTAEIDPYRFSHALLQAAASRGAGIYARTQVGQPVCRNGRVVLTTPDGLTLTTPHVVWATGYDAEPFLQRRTGRLASTWVLVSQPLDRWDGWPDRCLIWETSRPYAYARTTEDGRLMIGGEDEPCAECHRSRWRFAIKTRRLLARARQMFPRLDIEVAWTWAGTFASTDDGLPFIGSVPEWPGVTFTLGYGGNGITFAVMAAEILREACLGREHPDAWMFAFDRPGRSSAA